MMKVVWFLIEMAALIVQTVWAVRSIKRGIAQRRAYLAEQDRKVDHVRERHA